MSENARGLLYASGSDDAFDRVAQLVQRLLGVPMALVHLTSGGSTMPGSAGLIDSALVWRSAILRRLAGEAEPVAVPDLRDPELAGTGIVAYAGAPLTDAVGRTLGVLCAFDLVAREWTAGDLSLLSDLAAVCSSELRLRVAREAAEDARRHAELAHDQLALLAGLTETLASTLDTDEALNRLADSLVPRLADWCNVTLLDSEGRIRRVACAHHDPTKIADTKRLTELLLTTARESEVLRAVQVSGRPFRASGDIVEDLRRRTGNPELVELAVRLGYAAHLTAPIVAPLNRRVLGGVTLLNGPDRAPFSEADERIATDIGRRAGLAIDNSRL